MAGWARTLHLSPQLSEGVIAQDLRVRKGTMTTDEGARRLEEIQKDPGVSLLDWGMDVLGLPSSWPVMACERLPETIRVQRLHSDVNEVRNILSSFGAQPLPWYGDGWVLPWARQRPPSEKVGEILRRLHHTGRATLQEAASMLPPVLLRPEPGQVILDLCAAPGSKTTQIAELTDDEAVVIANEPNRGRSNMLATNRSRVGHRSVIVTSSDGRHYPRLPAPGADAVLVDAPCTGTGTTRKNPNVWWTWKPNMAVRMHRLQVDLMVRAAHLIKGGGRLMYSTCSLDPIENEAVVAEVLRRCAWLDLEPFDRTTLSDVACAGGMEEWSVSPKLRNPPPSAIMDQRADGASLSRTLRLWQDGNHGGFFVASLVSTDESGATARGLIPSGVDERPIGSGPTPFEPRPLEQEDYARLAKEWGDVASGALAELGMKRGKRWFAVTDTARTSIHDCVTDGGKGVLHPSQAWAPLRVEHAGVTVFKEEKYGLRPVREGLRWMARHLVDRTTVVPLETAMMLLQETQVDITEILGDSQVKTGSYLIGVEGTGHVIPVFVNQRLSLMVDEDERQMLLLMLGSEHLA